METGTVTNGYFQSILLALLGSIALLLTLTMDYFFGKSLALESDMQMIMGAAFVGIEVIVVGLAAVNGALIRDGFKWIGLGLAVFIVFGATLAMTATIGFGGAQRIGKSEAATAKVANANAQAQAQNADIIAQRQAYAQWLKNTVVTGATRAIRRDANNRLRELAKEPLPLKEIAVKSVSPDVQAETIVKTLAVVNVPTQIDSVQVFLTVGVALFLTLSQSICFGLSSYRWPKKARRGAPVAVTVPVLSNVEDSKIVRPSFRPVAASVEAVAERHDPGVDEDDDDADDLSDRLDEDVVKINKQRDHVARFLTECTRPSPSSRVNATAFYEAYVVWAQRNGEDALKQNRFGRICTALHIARDKAIDRRAWYVGRALVVGDEGAALADAA